MYFQAMFTQIFLQNEVVLNSFGIGALHLCTNSYTNKLQEESNAVLKSTMYLVFTMLLY